MNSRLLTVTLSLAFVFGCTNGYKAAPRAIDESQRKEEIDMTIDRLSEETSKVRLNKVSSDKCLSLRRDLKEKMRNYKDVHGENKGLESLVVEAINESGVCSNGSTTNPPPPRTQADPGPGVGPTSSAPKQSPVKNPAVAKIDALSIEVDTVEAEIVDKTSDMDPFSVSCNFKLTKEQCLAGLKNFNFIAARPELREKAFENIDITDSDSDTNLEREIKLNFNLGATAMLQRLSAQPKHDADAFVKYDAKKDSRDDLVKSLNVTLKTSGMSVECDSTLAIENCIDGLIKLSSVVKDSAITTKAFKVIRVSNLNCDVSDSRPICSTDDLTRVSVNFFDDSTVIKTFLLKQIDKNSPGAKVIDDKISKEHDARAKAESIIAAAGLKADCGILTRAECTVGLTSLSYIAPEIKGKAFEKIILAKQDSKMDDYKIVTINYNSGAKAMRAFLTAQASQNSN